MAIEIKVKKCKFEKDFSKADVVDKLYELWHNWNPSDGDLRFELSSKVYQALCGAVTSIDEQCELCGRPLIINADLEDNCVVAKYYPYDWNTKKAISETIAAEKTSTEPRLEDIIYKITFNDKDFVEQEINKSKINKVCTAWLIKQTEDTLHLNLAREGKASLFMIIPTSWIKSMIPMEG